MTLKDMLEEIQQRKRDRKEEQMADINNRADDFETRNRRLKLLRRQVRTNMDITEIELRKRQLRDFELERTRREVFGFTKGPPKKLGFMSGKGSGLTKEGSSFLGKMKKENKMFRI